MSRTAFTFAVAIALLVPSAATAATRYASPTGSGTACTQPSPCDIAEATRSSGTGEVQAGDEIILLAGTYTAVPTIEILDDNVSLHGETSGPRPTIESPASTAVFSNHTGTSVSHLNIEHTGGANGLVFSVGNGTVDEVVVDSAGTACSFGSFASSTHTMRNSICSTTRGGAAAINLTFGDTALELRNVTAVATAAINSHGLRADSDTDETMSVTGTNVIAASTATDAASDDVHVLSNGAGASTTITLDHSNYDKVFSTAVNGGSSTVTTAGTNNNQTSPPLFVDAAGGDFHQLGGSPTINAGADNALNGLTDIDGEARPSGLLTDIGADEFVDGDSDTVPDASDNCPLTANADQANNDGDSQGDVCDSDDDNDTHSDGTDNCPLDANADQADNDADDQGDVCDSDDDNDTVTDVNDNCPVDVNADQANNDGDSQGDVCDNDDDNDTHVDGADNCPVDANADQADGDGDGQGDACDSDDDNDALDDGSDNCPLTANADQANNDGDSQGDVCDSDDDNDTVADGSDNCPTQAGPAANQGCPQGPDSAAPQTTIDKRPAKKGFKRKAKFEFSASEPGSTFECSFDGAPFSACTSPLKRKVKVGKHVFEVRATDGAGNTDQSPARYRWRVKRR